MGKARGDFTEILIKNGTIGPDQIAEAKALQAQTGMKLGDALIKLGYCTPDQVMKAIAEHAGMQSVDLTDVTIPPTVVELVPESVARENVVMPFSFENNILQICVADPSNFETVDKLKFILNKDIQAVLAPQEQIIEAINRHYGQSETESVDSMLSEFTSTEIETTELEKVGAGGMVGASDDSEAPVVKLVNLIIQEAIALRASDIHVEPFADRVRIRYRIDGVLVERDSPPRRLLAPMISRLKIMGKMDIAEKAAVPRTVASKQDCPRESPFDLRVSALPTNHGQAIVMRILDRKSINVNIRDLGFSGRGLQATPVDHQTAQRHLPGHRPDRVGKDDHAVLVSERAEPARPEDHHGRGSGRVLSSRHQPSRGPAFDRTRLRPDHPRDVAASSEHHSRRWRDSRSGDGPRSRSRPL